MRARCRRERMLLLLLLIVRTLQPSHAIRTVARDGAFVGYSERETVVDYSQTVTADSVATEKIVNLSCFDENDECVEWASGGECVKNPVFMRTSCRESCKFCEPYIKKSPYYGQNLSLMTPHGEIRLRLLWDRAPETSHLMAELAEHPQANPECSFYRNEAVPEAGSTGPPYGLLQGVCARLASNPPKEQTTKIKRGHVAIIHPGKDFYIALMDHEDWSLGHTAWAVIDDLSVVETILQEPFTDQEHIQYGTHMRMMDIPMHFTLQLTEA